MVTALENYPSSSYPERVGLRKRQCLDFDDCYQGMGDSHEQRIHRYQDYLGEPAQKNEIALIREGLQRNQLTSNHRFFDEIESRMGIRAVKRGRGRPKHEEK